MIKSVLIANRGEIALRIIRGCRELGIETIAVYSYADRFATFARAADRALPIGPSPSSESYLCMDKILEVASKTSAESIHPGYGFLAENADFADAVVDAGLIWIGPPASAIRSMGDKLEARRIMTAAKVPVVPGSEVVGVDADSLKSICESMGYPVLIKAAAGGGGKGMRIVRSPDELKANLERAQSEARKAFSDDRVYVEKYIDRPRHIEIQVLADQHGHVIHLGERECSIQRRYQKVIEESPSVAVTDELRSKMGESAVKAAISCKYEGVGTVEFLLGEDGEYYFLEMNTRLQVEHPVTEMVTGIDLVAAQLRVASDEPLAFTQDDVEMRGHAIECRVYAEDPENNFLPSAGLLTRLHEPAGPGVRVDSGVEEGGEVSLYYDPQLAKLIVWGQDREEARNRMVSALEEYRISGVKHNLRLLHNVMTHPEFIAGNLTTHFLTEHDLTKALERDTLDAAIAAAIFVARKTESVRVDNGPGAVQAESHKWRDAGRDHAMQSGTRP